MTQVRTETDAIGLDGRSRDKLARWAGAAYLAYIAFGAASMVLQSRQVAWSDLTLTFHHIQQGAQLFRLVFFLEIVATMFFLLATWSYFALLKPVDKNLALLLVLMNLCGIAAEDASAIVKYGALQCAVGKDLLPAFTPDQMQALSMLLLRACGRDGVRCGNVVLRRLAFSLRLADLSIRLYSSLLGRAADRRWRSLVHHVRAALPLSRLRAVDHAFPSD